MIISMAIFIILCVLIFCGFRFMLTGFMNIGRDTYVKYKILGVILCSLMLISGGVSLFSGVFTVPGIIFLVLMGLYVRLRWRNFYKKHGITVRQFYEEVRKDEQNHKLGEVIEICRLRSGSKKPQKE